MRPPILIKFGGESGLMKEAEFDNEKIKIKKSTTLQGKRASRLCVPEEPFTVIKSCNF